MILQWICPPRFASTQAPWRSCERAERQRTPAPLNMGRWHVSLLKWFHCGFRIRIGDRRVNKSEADTGPHAFRIPGKTSKMESESLPFPIPLLEGKVRWIFETVPQAERWISKKNVGCIGSFTACCCLPGHHLLFCHLHFCDTNKFSLC